MGVLLTVVESAVEDASGGRIDAALKHLGEVIDDLEDRHTVAPAPHPRAHPSETLRCTGL